MSDLLRKRCDADGLCPVCILSNIHVYLLMAGGVSYNPALLRAARTIGHALDYLNNQYDTGTLTISYLNCWEATK